MGATLFGATSIQPTPQPTSRRRDSLALVFQNLLTVIVRLRANRQVPSDSQAFRTQMQSALRAAEKEVYSLCILLGYRGKYGLGDQDSVRPVLDAIAEKIRRVRGTLPGLSPEWAIPGGAIEPAKADRWVRRLAMGAVFGVLMVVLFFVLFKILLGGDASRVPMLGTV